MLTGEASLLVPARRESWTAVRSMIQQESRLRVADNSGAQGGPLHQGARRHRRRYATIGDVFVATVKDAIPGAAGEEGRGREVRRRPH